MSVEKEVNINKFRLIKQIHFYGDVDSILPLKDGSFAYSNGEEIFFVTLDKILSPYYVIKNDEDCLSLVELDDGLICGGKTKIKIWSIKKVTEEVKGTIKLPDEEQLRSLLLIPGDRFVANTNLGITIYKSIEPYSDTPVHVVTKDKVSDATYIKGRDELIADDYEKKLIHCWNMTNYQCTRTVQLEVEPTQISIVDDNSVVFNCNEKFFVLYLSQGKVESIGVNKNCRYNDGSGKGVMLRDGHSMLIAGSNLSVYDFKTKTLKEKKFEDEVKLKKIAVVNDNTLFTVAWGFVQWWKY